MPRVGILEVTPPSNCPSGTIRLDGAKHAFAHALACAALADEGTLLDVPDHVDARSLRSCLALIFDHVTYDPESKTLRFGRPRRVDRVDVPPELTGKSRSLFCLYPALLTRAREIRIVAPPSGCAIGARPSNWYLDVLAEFGVVAEQDDGTLRMRWPRRQPADVAFSYPTMTGTVLAIAAAAAAAGRSSIVNRSLEPSCDDLIACLRGMGGEAYVRLDRLDISSPGRFERVAWAVPHDRIHAVTYVTAGLIARGEVTVVGSGPLRIPRFVAFLRSAGCDVREGSDRLTARLPADEHLQPVDLTVGSEPKFSSDWAPFAALLLSLRSAGTSQIVDDVFPERLQFFEVLRSRGLAPVDTRAVVTPEGRAGVHATIQGDPGTVLRSGEYPTVPDIRGSAAIALAALASDAPTEVVDDFHIRRGYTDFAGDLCGLGLSVSRGER